MFCTVCEAEYEAGITHCPDDNTPLVERLTPENTLHDSSEASFVSLHKLGSPAEAEMVNDILTKNGVRSVIKGGSDAFSPLLSATSEGAEIFVDERDYDRALELYNSFFGADTTPLTGGMIEDEVIEHEEKDEE
jgi:Putative prokaryotic signal transducing protein